MYYGRFSVKFKIILILFAFLKSPISFSQDSVLPLWDSVVNDPSIDEMTLLRFAQVAKAELQLLDLYLDMCQQALPESNSTYNVSKAHLVDVGNNIYEFLSRYSDQELTDLGAPSDNQFQQNFEMQREMMNSRFPSMSEEMQSGFCTDIRPSIMELTVKQPVTRF